MNQGVVVTGASSGIGFAIAAELARAGYAVFGTVRRAEDEAALVQAGVVPVRMDVTDTASIASALAAVRERLAGWPLAALVNNAGMPAAGPLELLPLDELRRVLEVNLIGQVAVTQAFLPLLKAARARIVNMSSVAGRAVLPFLGPYAASKFGLEAISDALRRELAPFGVRVIVIEPGNIQSKIWDKVEQLDLSRYRGTPYERVLGPFRDAALKGGREAPPATLVSRVVLRALTARRPPIRVIVSRHPWAERLAVWLPDRAMDWVMMKMVWKGRGGM
jgi:NAD(P)-dependent dehydrogenase (short-subunit alcohol dehydrogenase family)